MKKGETLLIFCIALLLVAICFVIFFYPKSSDNAKWDKKPMIMVDNTIYMDTGKEIEEEIAESFIAGKIISSVDGTNKPTKNGESNFGCEGAPYAFYNDGLVVMINNKWIYFEKEKN
ncbi:MAG: hypothetical protein ACFWTJ_03190 [Lachnoclostridium sp.]|jgi:hypothetical protein